MSKRLVFSILIIPFVLVILIGCAGSSASNTVEVYNPSGIRQDGVYVDELLKKTMTETKKTRPALAAQFPKVKVEKITVAKDMFLEVNDLFYKRGWTDGLPIVPPTQERVQEMLKGTNLPPDQVIGTVELMKGQATVEKIAVNAVMAGARPEYMPVIIAGVQAICEPDFDLYGLSSTTNPDTPMYIINGPIAKQLDINSGTNALGRGWIANSTIGRALKLIVNNIGGSWPGLSDMSVLGTPGDYSMLLAENEDANPWQPLSVDLGYPKGANVITALGAEGTHNLLASNLGSIGFMNAVADHLTGLERPHRANVLLIIAQDTAGVLARDGWTKPKIEQYVKDRAKIPFSKYKERFIDQGVGVPDQFKEVKDPNELIPTPLLDRLIIIVSGGPGVKNMIIPVWGNSKPQSKEIKLPPNWDQLIKSANN
jgi:hypothetical protein